MKLVKSRPKRWSLEIPDEARKILHHVGLALFAFGLLDIGVMIYCLANDISFSSSFNIFAVISGIYLWRGHPCYVKWVTRAAGSASMRHNASPWNWRLIRLLDARG